jgi:Zn-finger protein
MMFLVGLQFGQINSGSWNHFMVAAKEYFASQSSDCNENTFFWNLSNKHAGNAGGYARGAQESCKSAEIFDRLGEALSLGELDNNFAEDCEIALCAYYAMTQEILSRCKVNDNGQSVTDREHCTIGKIFRLEGLESLVPMGIVTGNDTDTEPYKSKKSVANDSKRPVIVSASAAMFASSLDKPVDFPPPIKAITKYANVHHARIFGCHMFNVDFATANRKLPKIIDGRDGRSTYASSSPFFKDEQREFLLIPRGLSATVIGILAWASDKSSCNVITNLNPNEVPQDLNGFVELLKQENGGFVQKGGKKGEIKIETKHLMHVQCCLGDANGIKGLTKHYADRTPNGSVIWFEGLFAPDKCQQRSKDDKNANYADRLKTEICRLTNVELTSGNGGGENGAAAVDSNVKSLFLESYACQLKALEFNTVYAKK